jgi:hypothetical protein
MKMDNKAVLFVCEPCNAKYKSEPSFKVHLKSSDHKQKEKKLGVKKTKIVETTTRGGDERIVQYVIDKGEQNTIDHNRFAALQNVEGE